MIIPDINLLVYAYNSSAPLHKESKKWWESVLSGTETVGLPWVVCLGFVRLMTSRKILVTPIHPRIAIQHVQSWMERPIVVILHPGPRHLDILNQFARQDILTSTLVTDAHLAALAMEQQAEIHSNDSDFSRFPGLYWRNPLIR